MGSTLSPVSITPGAVVFGGASGLPAQDDPNLHWNQTLLRLGVKTNAPTSPVTVAGMIETTADGVKFPDATIQTTAATSTVYVAIYQNVGWTLAFVDRWAH